MREIMHPRLYTIAVITQLLLLTCGSLSVRATDGPLDDLMDFDFEKKAKSPTSEAVQSEPIDSTFGDFLDIIDTTEAADPANGMSHIQQKEKHVKLKLARAWNNPNMQRKFAEVLPILKVMTSEQKIALAALVSAQVGAKQGRELNLDEVSYWPSQHIILLPVFFCIVTKQLPRDSVNFVFALKLQLLEFHSVRSTNSSDHTLEIELYAHRTAAAIISSHVLKVYTRPPIIKK